MQLIVQAISLIAALGILSVLAVRPSGGRH
jgi:hypothetical protein